MYIKQDAWSKFFSTPLYDFNPESLLFLKQSGDAGYLAERDRLFAAMYGEWDVLLKDVDKMCNAVATLNYTVVPTTEEGSESHAAAQKVADVVSKALWMRSPNNELGQWRHTFLQMVGTLYHAICRSVNVHEIIWERSAGLVYPRCYAPVQPNYYGWAVQANEPDRLVLYRDGNPYGKGEPFPKGKFVVALNPNGPDHPMRAARFISLVGWFGAAKWGLPWLMKYCQVFGLPWRKFTVGSEEDKAAKLAELASNPVISDTVVFGDENVEIINAAASGASIPQAEILRLAENACHKLILGQTLTSDTSDNGGSLAQAKVHAGVMADEVMYVGNYVCEILNQQLIPEIVRANFGAIPVELMPELRCAVPQAEANLDQLQMYKGLQEMGVRLVESDVCDKFGVPIAGPDDKVLEPAGQQAAQPGMPGEVPRPDDEPPTPGPQKPTLAEELNDEPIEAAAAPDVPDIDALSAAADAAAADAHRRWSEPFFKALAAALDQGLTPSEILKSLEGWNPDTEALADALAVTARVALGHGPDDIEAANPGGCNQYGHGWVDNICPWGGGAGGGAMGTGGSPGGMFISGPNAGNVSKGIDPDEEKRKKEEAAKAEAEAKRKEAEAKAEAERKAAEEAKAKEEAAKRESEEKAKREAVERELKVLSIEKKREKEAKSLVKKTGWPPVHAEVFRNEMHKVTQKAEDELYNVLGDEYFNVGREAVPKSLSEKIDAADSLLNEEAGAILADEVSKRQAVMSVSYRFLIEGKPTENDAELKTGGILSKRNGRFQNCFEAGRRGEKYLEYRNKVERRMLGAKDISAAQRPTYAFLERSLETAIQNTNNGNYGDVYVTFEEKVRERTTFLGDDSFENFGSGKYATPITSPNVKKGLSLSDAQITALNRGRGLASAMSSSYYMEAQIHGRLTTNHVKSVGVPFNLKGGRSNKTTTRGMASEIARKLSTATGRKTKIEMKKTHWEVSFE